MTRNTFRLGLNLGYRVGSNDRSNVAQLAPLRAGLAKSGRVPAEFDIAPTVPFVPGADWVTCANRVRAYAALYLGGMGSREDNHYTLLAARMGFGDEAAIVQDKFLAEDYPGAMLAEVLTETSEEQP